MTGTSLKKGFGGGLDAVLGIIDSKENVTSSDEKFLKTIMVHQLIPGTYQPRRDFNQESLKELSESIESQGILQPIVVREASNNEYEIIAGERRWRAAQMAGLQQVPVVICSISDESALALGLIENIQRQDLNPIEEARAIQRLISEFSLMQHDVAKKIGKSRTAVTNLLRVLNLPDDVQHLIEQNNISLGHAKILAGFEGKECSILASKILAEQLTVRDLEKVVKYRNKKNEKQKENENIYLYDSERFAIECSLGVKLNIKLNENHKGKIEILVKDSKEVEKILTILAEKRS